MEFVVSASLLDGTYMYVKTNYIQSRVEKMQKDHEWFDARNALETSPDGVSDERH